MRTPSSLAIFASIGFASPALAQGLTEGWEFDGRVQAVIVASTFDDTERLPAESLLGEVSLRATAEKTLQNSAEIGVRFEAKAQQDNPARAGFTGNIEPFGELAGSSGPLPLRGAFSGLTRYGPIEDASLSGAIETAQIYIDGGYGQLSAGLGRGIAARFHEGAPDIFTHASAANPKLDPAGLNIVRTENDLTGPALKLTYQTPRILGVRAGISFTPEADMAGVDRDPRRSVVGVETPELSNIIEGSVQLSRKITSQDFRIRASGSYAAGDVSNANAASLIDDVEVWTIGSELEFESFSIGADYLWSNNGIQMDGDYSAWSIGATSDVRDWTLGVRYGESEDENVRSRGKNWSIGGATKISQSAKISIGYQVQDVKFGELTNLNAISGAISPSEGVVVEITLSR